MSRQQRHSTQLEQRHIAWLEAAPSPGSDTAPVVLVHGLGTSDRWWLPTIPVLSERYRVLAPDLVGFGRSAGQPVQLDVAADELAAWAAAIGLERATWVGHSMGGQVTIDLAARYPELVERLVLVDAAGLPVSKDVTRHLLNVVRASPFMPLAAYPVAVECVLRCGPVAITRASHQILSTDLESRVRAIGAPTLVVWGGRDTLLPPPYGRRLAAMIPGASYVELERAGHSPQWEAPNEFEGALLSFLEAPGAAGSTDAATDTAPTLMPGVAVTAPTGGRVVNRYVPVGDWSVQLRVGRPGEVATALDPVPIVFVHGYVQASRSWLPTLKRLARRHLVLAPDLPGFGWTQSAQPSLDVPGQAAALAAIMDAAGVGRAVLVGSSLGAQVVAQFAADHPDRALGIVLVGPTFDPKKRSLPRQVVRAAGGLLREWPSVWFEHLRDLVLAGPSRIAASFRLGWSHRIETVLPEVRAPAVVVRGSRDSLVSREWARKAAALMPNARALEIGGAGRALGQSAPEALARIVDEQVAAVTAAPAPTAAAARD